MSYTKTHDLAVKVGEYQKGGETKGRYENIGQILSDGQNELVMIKRTFNPAGVPNPDGRDSVLVSKFAAGDSKPAKPAPSRGEPFDDSQDLPF
jgi:hypothetical protein